MTHQPTTPPASLATPQAPLASLGCMTMDGTPAMARLPQIAQLVVHVAMPTFLPTCFAVIGAVSTRIGTAVGAHRLLLTALVLTTVGLALRPLAGGAAMFIVLSVVALTGRDVERQEGILRALQASGRR